MGRSLFGQCIVSKHRCTDHCAYALPISELALVAATSGVDRYNHRHDYTYG